MSGVRWYELNAGPGTPTVRQQGTQQPSADYRWMGSAAMDKTGGIAIGYNVSNSTTIKPSIWYAFRGATHVLPWLAVISACALGAWALTRRARARVEGTEEGTP